jgi:hypothetical protein
MGEAKRRAATQDTMHEILDGRLRDIGVDTSKLGFTKHLALLADELGDYEVAKLYAHWVQSRPRTAEYDERVRTIVPRLASYMADLFEQNGMRFSCFHASLMMQGILDRMGIWSYGLAGSTIMEVASKSLRRDQCICDTADFPDREPGHAWVVVPPFVIVDPTIRLQNPDGDAMNEFLPPIIATDNSPPIKPGINDIVSVELRREYARADGRVDKQLHHRLVPTLKEFNQDFPGRQVRTGELDMRYVPVHVLLSAHAIEEMNNAGQGMTGAQVWTYVAQAFPQFLLPDATN